MGGPDFTSITSLMATFNPHFFFFFLMAERRYYTSILSYPFIDFIPIYLLCYSVLNSAFFIISFIVCNALLQLYYFLTEEEVLKETALFNFFFFLYNTLLSALVESYAD